jgi:carboxylesterase type B
MKYKAEQKVQTNIFHRTNIEEGDIFRDFALRMLKELPIEKVKKLFNLKVIYGTDEELQKAYKNKDKYKVEVVKELISDGNTLFTAEINIK